MDFFGIGAALKGTAEIYLRAMRQTGRTSSMLDCLQDGDRVITASPQEKRQLEIRIRERGLDVAVIHLDPGQFYRSFDLPRSKGRTLLDHGLVEHLYKRALDAQAQDIQRFQELLSNDEKRAPLLSNQGIAEFSKWH